ncbi:septal ring lytic transglycosylase RlpA family protein [Qipengyuania zhejiangensis]|uniref:septal ring lytic transglycosylase RlpA family protein n=1 Tax=Qipengyuania zhejiangensis TaxID=3077782 RepID=UPI002D78EF84|nr:septal ring lytic transglycosylase RlpA family protein [Qipengyuania sp. Z2]
MAKRTLRTLVFIAALTLPLSAGHSEERADDATFEASFERYEDLPAAPEPAAHVVDLDTFDAPVEQPAEAKPLGSGNASFYGRKFNGRRTASGERFDMNQLTAAHRTLPFGSLVRVTNPSNGREVVVRINDRGPFHGNRVIDVSRAAATQLGLIQRGHGHVELALLDS